MSGEFSTGDYIIGEAPDKTILSIGTADKVPRSFLDRARPNKMESNGVEPTRLDENGFLICSPTVLGFSYGGKMWRDEFTEGWHTCLRHIVDFAVAGIRDIEWNYRRAF